MEDKMSFTDRRERPVSNDSRPKPSVTLQRNVPDRVLLTDRREELISGNYDPENSTDRAAKSRLRNSTQTVLTELTKVAQSPHVDNSKTLPPELVGNLLEALYVPTTEPEDHEEYRKDLVYQMRRVLTAEIHEQKDEEIAFLD